MTGDKFLFVELDESVRSEVKIGDDRYVTMQEKGIIAMNVKYGKKLIHDVMYVSGLAQNLISLG